MYTKIPKTVTKLIQKFITADMLAKEMKWYHKNIQSKNPSWKERKRVENTGERVSSERAD
jgi:hypothetical protein